MERRAPVTAPCPICGSTEYLWGVMMGAIGYLKNQDPSQTALVNMRDYKLFRHEPLRTRLCHNCGNVQLFDAKHPIDFDGNYPQNER